MVGRPRLKRGRTTASRSPAATRTDATSLATQSQNAPLAPPPLPALSQISPQTPPHSPQSSGASKRKFEDIAEINEGEQDSKLSFSANASIMTESERPSRRRRGTYTLAASIVSIEKTTRTRSRRATVERSVTRNPLSSGFSKPNDSEKLVVKSRDGRECWLCSQSNSVMLETAHNVVASNRDLFLNYRDTVGIFPPNLRHLASPHNLVTLCRNCHCVYDCQQPRWIILPTNLEYFLNHELTDYDSRIQAASKGLTKPRTVPTALEYATASPTNLYMPYFFEESVMPRLDLENGPSRFPRAYGGAPTTMILKAGLGINQPKIKASKNSSLPFAIGLPPSVRQQVTHLFELWDRDPPSPKKQLKSPVKQPSKDDDDNNPPSSESDENNSQTGNKKRRTKNNPTIRKRKSPHSSQTHADDHHDELADICAPTKKKARVVSGSTVKSSNASPGSQVTNSNTAPHSRGLDSQDSSSSKRYNLRSYYRTPPTSPEFMAESPAKQEVKKGKRKQEEAITDVRMSKRKRISSSSESVLEQSARRVTQATLTKKDEKALQSKTRCLKSVARVPTVARSLPRPNDPISTKPIRSLAQEKVSKRRKGTAGSPPFKRSVKKNTAALFADMGLDLHTSPNSGARGDPTPSKQRGLHIPNLTQLLPPKKNNSLEINHGFDLKKHDSRVNDVDSLDAQSGDEGNNYDGEDDGYASDSGSERPDKEDWAWGPSHTANDVVDACVNWFGVGTSGRIGD